MWRTRGFHQCFGDHPKGDKLQQQLRRRRQRRQPPAQGSQTPESGRVATAPIQEKQRPWSRQRTSRRWTRARLRPNTSRWTQPCSRPSKPCSRPSTSAITQSSTTHRRSRGRRSRGCAPPGCAPPGGAASERAAGGPGRAYAPTPADGPSPARVPASPARVPAPVQSRNPALRIGAAGGGCLMAAGCEAVSDSSVRRSCSIRPGREPRMQMYT